MRHQRVRTSLFFRSLALGAALVLVAVASAPAAPAAAPSFAESASAVVVEVPVQVVRDGEPVRGLTAADFELSDGRKKVTLSGFDVVDLSTPAAAGQRSAIASLPTPAARRHFLLLFDLAFSDLRGIVRAREAAASMVGTLHPSDLIGVATYSAIKGPQLVLGFTSDRRQVQTAIATLGSPALLDMNPDPLRLVLGEMRGVAASTTQQMGSGRGEGEIDTKNVADSEMVEILQSAAQESQRMTNTAQRTAVVNFTNTLTDLAKVMGSIVGRKYVVYLSEGFDASLLQGATDGGQRDELMESAQSGDIWTADSEQMFGDTKSLNAVEKMLEELRRADCVVESVDVAGLRAAGDLGNSRPASG
ncbi:MAG TPA: hypothetical protein VN923_18150, partial [Thermoanaerobaculia bacterium]|nr:hypothetical protein [Thermoanaerobaculia bacterium]